MIEKFRIKNFKSFEDATLPLSHLTLLIGANASGKSNLIEALRFMNWLAQGKTLKEIDYQMRDDISPIRGDLADFPRRGTKEFSFCVEVPHASATLELGFTLAQRTTLGIRQEQLRLNNVVAYEYSSSPNVLKFPEKELTVTDAFKKPLDKPVFLHDEVFIALAADTLGTADIKAHSTEIIKRCADFKNLFSSARFLDANLQKMRRPGREADTELTDDGGNLAGVLYNLCKNDEHKATILGLIQQLPEQNIRDITFEKFRDDIHMSLCETFGGKVQEWDSASLSDGTLRVLAIGAALLSAPKGALVVVEEIDNGVHPSRAKHLITQLLEIAKERDLSLLLSTHNPALMNAIPDNAVKDAVFCYRDDKTGASKLKKLEDFDEFIELTARAPLGDLSTRNELKKSLTSGSAEEKKAAALKWFDTFEKGL